MTRRDLYIDGHKLVALNLNPVETPGHPVFLLHGIGGSVHFWNDDQTRVFQEQGPCYALSLPGHYPAAFPTEFREEQITAIMIAELLVKALGEIVGDRPVTLAGLSTGGFSALAIAAHAPEMVRRVICISGFCQGRWTGALGLGQMLARRGRLGRALFKYLYRGPNLTAEQFCRKWSVYASDVKAMRACPHFRACTDASYPDFMQLDLDKLLGYFAVMPDIDIRDWLPRIKAPTLVMAGDRDPSVPPGQAVLIQQGIPRAELEMIEGGGHMLFAERPLEYQRALYNWLQRNRMVA
jgi:pimeloyl-ACP methyl ester carboxylesterase